jgi:hypothetical protein
LEGSEWWDPGRVEEHLSKMLALTETAFNTAFKAAAIIRLVALSVQWTVRSNIGVSGSVIILIPVQMHPKNPMCGPGQFLSCWANEKAFFH